MDSKTLARLRPTDDSAAAIRSALDRVRAERHAAEQRLTAQMTMRATLLLHGTNQEIRAAEEVVRDAELDILRLETMATALDGQLAVAVAREEDDARAVLVREAATSIEAWNKWLASEYEAPARAIARGLELERTARQNIDAVRRSVGGLPVELPVLARAFVGRDARGLGFLTRLPSVAPDVEPFWWPR